MEILRNSNFRCKRFKFIFTLFESFRVKLKKLMDSEKEKFLELRCYKRNRYILGFPANGNELVQIIKPLKNLELNEF